MDAIAKTLSKSRSAAQKFAFLPSKIKNQALESFANLLKEHAQDLVKANKEDLELAQRSVLSGPLLERLKLDSSKIQTLHEGAKDIAAMEDPVGKITWKMQLDDGLILERISVPIGVIGVVFESRPDVIPQILCLALKSGNAVVLKGGKEAQNSNHAFMNLIEELGKLHPELPEGWAVLLDTREEFRAILDHPEYIDLVIPRGSYDLVRNIMENTSIPVLGHAEGVCHIYVHSTAHIESAIPIVIDSKTQYPSACNALETLLVDEKIAANFFKLFAGEAKKSHLQLIGCKKTCSLIPAIQAATDEDWRKEYGDLRLAVKVVDGLDDAIAHINRYSSHHTDSILGTDHSANERFLSEVDSACVFANASTRFSDGYRFGLGAEVGISTGRIHARGPVGIEGLVTYKYKLRGHGQIVASYSGPKAKPYQHKKLD